jgi:hypothetical protein
MILRPEGVQIHTSGSTVSVAQGVGKLMVNPSSLIAALTITMPSSPSDRDNLLIMFGGTITGISTVVTLLSFSGGSILGIVPTTQLAGSISYEYDASISKWFRTS